MVLNWSTNQRDEEDQGYMRSLAKRRVDYFTPDVPPSEASELPEWLSMQLKNLANAIFNVNTLHLERMHHFPERFKPREGDIILAAEGLAGVSAGLYYYDGSEWVLIGS